MSTDTYPCADCGVSRTEGGTVFTVCDACWCEYYGHSPDCGHEQRYDGGET